MIFRRVYSIGRPVRGFSPARSLCLAGGAVVVAVVLSLFLSAILHVRLPVYAHVHLYGAILIATHFGGLLSGIAAFVLAFLLADFFLTEPLYVLFPVEDLPDFATFSIAAGGVIWIGYLGRKIANGRQ